MFHNRLWILCYHGLLSTPSRSTDDVKAKAGFEEQLDVLDRVANVVRLGDALSCLDRGMRLPPRAVAITFDDGYRDALDVAAPVLDQRGLPATFFLTTGFLSRTTLPWWEALAATLMGSRAGSLTHAARTFKLEHADERRLAYGSILTALKGVDRQNREDQVAELVRQLRPDAASEAWPCFLDWEGARSLAARGFEIGSHTLNHPILSRESHAEQVHELSESRQMLEDQLSTDVTVVAYPNGMTTDYDLQTLAATREAGYRAGVTCRFGWNDARSPRFEMRRVLIEPTTGRKGLVQALVNPVRAWSAHRVRRFSQTLRRSLVPGPRHAGQGRD